MSRPSQYLTKQSAGDGITLPSWILAAVVIAEATQVAIKRLRETLSMAPAMHEKVASVAFVMLNAGAILSRADRSRVARVVVVQL
jgi:hypothetical protein